MTDNEMPQSFEENMMPKQCAADAHDIIMTAAMLLADINADAKNDDYHILMEMVDRRNEPYIGVMLEYIIALADAFSEDAALNEGTGCDRILLESNVLEAFDNIKRLGSAIPHPFRRGAQINNMVVDDREYTKAINPNDKKDQNYYDNRIDATAKNSVSIKPSIARAYHDLKWKQSQATPNNNEIQQTKTSIDKLQRDEYKQAAELAKRKKLSDAVKDYRQRHASDESIERAVKKDYNNNTPEHIAAVKKKIAERDSLIKKKEEVDSYKAGQKDFKDTKKQISRNYLHDVFASDGELRNRMRETRADVTDALNDAKLKYLNAGPGEKYKLKNEYDNLKRKTSPLRGFRLIGTAINTAREFRKQADDKTKNLALVRRYDNAGNKTYSVADRRDVKDTILGNKTVDAAERYQAPKVKDDVKYTYGDGTVKSLNHMNISSSDGLNAGNVDGKHSTYTEGYSPFIIDGDNAPMPGQFLSLDGSAAIFEGNDDFILSELLSLNGFEVNESNINVLGKAIDSGSAKIIL